jgi:hypothetical protein
MPWPASQAALHIYTIKMAGMFLFSTSTISLRTRIVPRLALLGVLGFAHSRQVQPSAVRANHTR